MRNCALNMKKLPKNVHSLICASSQINSYIKAVQELVYNSLDANSTSIAVRINTDIGMIQVVDNGCGIVKEDFKHLGRKHMTSKLIDVSTLKSAPTNYGYRGQSLANIIQISQSVKITSRYERNEETYVKTFEHGKERKIDESNSRPSKGTTVETRGFLYNLGIQKKSIKNPTELQNIKTFLELLSVVHCGVSISLRDDSNNEIMLKIHKNRDIYQTLSLLYDVDKNDLQELQVEKKNYKVKAYIGRSEDMKYNHIYLNGKYLSETSKLHKVINKSLSKASKETSRNIKSKRIYNQGEDDAIFNQKPYYFIFISCPYIDYEIIEKTKETTAEFKNWDQINKLLEKLTKFYHGDVKVKENVKVPEQNVTVAAKRNKENTKEEVKKIIERILSSNTKNLDVDKMQNGVKGKLIKRKFKNKARAKLSLTKILPEKSASPNLELIRTDEHSGIDLNNVPKEKIKKPKANNQAKILSPELIEINVKSKQKPDEIKNQKSRRNKISLALKFAMDTDTVKQRRQDLAQKTNKLLEKAKSNVIDKIFSNRTVEYSNIVTNNKNIMIRKKLDEIIIREPKLPKKDLNLVFTKKNQPTIIKQPKTNATKPYASTYDLLQTILSTQTNQTRTDNGYVVEYKRNIHYNKTSNPRLCSNKNIENNAGEKSLLPIGTFQSHHYDKPNEEFKNITGNFMNLNDANTFSGCEFSLNQNVNRFDNVQNINPFNVNENLNQIRNEQYLKQFRSNRKSFITKKSMDNFINLNSVIKRRKLDKRGLIKKSYSNLNKLFDQKYNIFEDSAVRSSYTIEFTQSKEQNGLNGYHHESIRLPSSLSNYLSMQSLDNDKSVTEPSNHHYNDHCETNYNKNILVSDTITENSLFMNTEVNDFEDINEDAANYQDIGFYNSNDASQYETVNKVNSQKTYTLESWNEVCFENYMYNKSQIPDATKNSIDYVFVSTQNNNSTLNNSIEEVINPMDVCETVIGSEEVIQREFMNSFNDNVMNRTFTKDYISNRQADIQGIEEVSHHFTVSNNIANNEQIDIDNQNIIDKKDHRAEIENNIDKNAFNIVNRLGFLPKGLSQIFQNCNSKIGCSYNLNEEYYEDEIYDNFANKIQNRVEIFEPRVQEVGDFTTKDIEKANMKLNKDVASLKFDSEAIKDCKVLGQVDAKFIAALIRGISDTEESEFLVLFDQHAVHERIRLENNLADYFNENQWKSVPLDEVTLKLSKDDVRFLHNFKTKFFPLGLEWTIMNDTEVSITGIPEAILGKNPRPVEKVLKATTNLIKEEINNIKLQSGCISIQPKSILELVFSEACRYAIKFGDQLSKAECCELITKLSFCKTPFQCAHGRPVMAVITDIKPYGYEYKIDPKKLNNFIVRNNTMTT